MWFPRDAFMLLPWVLILYIGDSPSSWPHKLHLLPFIHLIMVTLSLLGQWFFYALVQCIILSLLRTLWLSFICHLWSLIWFYPIHFKYVPIYSYLSPFHYKSCSFKFKFKKHVHILNPFIFHSNSQLLFIIIHKCSLHTKIQKKYILTNYWLWSTIDFLVNFDQSQPKFFFILNH